MTRRSGNKMCDKSDEDRGWFSPKMSERSFRFFLSQGKARPRHQRQRQVMPDDITCVRAVRCGPSRAKNQVELGRHVVSDQWRRGYAVRHDAWPSASRQSCRFSLVYMYMALAFSRIAAGVSRISTNLQEDRGEFKLSGLANSTSEKRTVGVGRGRLRRRPRNPGKFASSARAGLHRAGSPKPQDGRSAGRRWSVFLGVSWWWWWRPARYRSIHPPPNTGHGGKRCRSRCRCRASSSSRVALR